MAIRNFPLNARLEVDTVAKTATVVLSIPSGDGKGDVDVFRQNITSSLSAADKERIKYALDAQ